jgi:hypothetical protein
VRAGHDVQAERQHWHAACQAVLPCPGIASPFVACSTLNPKMPSLVSAGRREENAGPSLAPSNVMLGHSCCELTAAAAISYPAGEGGERRGPGLGRARLGGKGLQG